MCTGRGRTTVVAPGAVQLACLSEIGGLNAVGSSSREQLQVPQPLVAAGITHVARYAMCITIFETGSDVSKTVGGLRGQTFGGTKKYC